MRAVPESFLSADTSEKLRLAASEYWQMGGRDTIVHDMLRTHLGDEDYFQFLDEHQALDDHLEANLNATSVEEWPTFNLTLENVAKGKRAWQSSLSKWSQPDDAERALNDDGTRDFSFHTGVDDRPWWMVDLGEQYPIHSIVAGNRRDCLQDKAKNMVVEVSRDGETWYCVHEGKLFWRGDLTLPLEGEIIARYVRLSLPERSSFHLSKVEVWTKRNSFVVAERRADGFGSRLQSLLNAAYLAKVLNCELKVTWPDNIIGYAGEFSADVKTEDRTILGHSIEPASEIFSPAFIKRHIADDSISADAKIARRSNVRASDILSGTVQDASGIINGPMNGLETSLAPELAPNRGFGLPDIFDQLPFSDKMAAAIKAANDVPLSPKSAAVHIRTGDLVYGNYRFHGRRFINKAVPIPLAKMAIEKLLADGYSVILFGEDETSLHSLREKYGVVLASESNEHLGLTGVCLAIFDIVLMSRTSAIWGAESGFVQTARDISRTADYVGIHQAFAREEQARYFAADIQENSSFYDPQQTAFAIWSLFWLTDQTALEDRVAMMDKAADLDPSNKIYLVAKASMLFEMGREQEGDQVLGTAISDGWLNRSLWGGTGRLHILAGKYRHRFHLQDFFPSLFAAAERGMPSAVLAKSMIEEAGYVQA